MCALGDTEAVVVIQFLLEGTVLGVVGSILGIIAGTVLAEALTALGIPIVIPNAGRPVPIHIDIFLAEYLIAVALAFVSTVGAAVFPALRAARMNIVDALRHNV